MNIINSITNVCKRPNVENNKAVRKFGKYPNLQPLAQDTISFSGMNLRNTKAKIDEISVVVPHSDTETKPVDYTGDITEVEGKEPVKAPQDDKSFEQADRTSLKLAQGLYNDTEYAYSLLKFILAKTLDTTVLDSDSPEFERHFIREISDNRNKPIYVVTSRRKKPDSICEKMAENHLRSKKAAKENLHDLIGARIILTGNTTKEGDYALEKLTEAVSKNHLRIKSVKIHGQEDPSTKYVTKSKIDKLVAAARKNGNPLCTYQDKPRDSGYLAVHIITDEIQDGFQAEIQIMGANVERFKQLEDIVYKCAFGKNVPKKYAPIAEKLAILDKNKTLKAEFLEYTKRAYAYERKKVFDPDSFNQGFLPIPEDLAIPPELDFNKLQSMKNSIDAQNKSK